MEPQQQQGLRTVGAWALGSHIGAGSFAIVWRARHVQTGQEAAVKEIALSKLNAKLRQSLESEVAILKRIRHENIVQLLEVIEEADRLYLVMEYCAGGDLAHLLRAVKRLPEAAAQHLMRQLAAGLRQMWAHHLVHRDLKPQNLLLSEASANATLKIADFGFARNLQPQGLAETLCGSPLYMAPEILHFHKYDAKADLWSIGAILYELLVGRPPFTGANQFQLLRNIERSEARLPDALAAQLSPHCRHLIHCLLRRNPVERLSFEEFFRHPFVATPEEAAAPLPPRAPFSSAATSLAAAAVAAAAGGLGGGSTRLAQLGAAPGPAAGQQRTLLFSTSAPAVAAALGPKSRSSGSIPQQVLGFQQARQPREGASAVGSAAPLSQGSPAGAAVRLGGLSHQLKPRRSLDLDGAAGQQAAAHQLLQQRQQGQVRPQPVAGRRLGSIQRVQGFQPAALLPGQSQQAHWAPTQRSASSAAVQLRSQQNAVAAGASAASQAAAALLPGGRPASQQTVSRPSAAAALAAAAPAGAPHSAAGHSMHSEDDDYVLVDTSLSAHTAPGGRGGSTRAVSPQGPSRSASAEGSLAGSRHAYASAEEDVFAVHPPGDGHTAAVAAAPPTWLGAPRWRFLQRVAHVLRHAADARQAAAASAGDGQAGQHAALRACLSLHLAALQLLDHALDGHAAAAAAAAEPQPLAAGAAELEGGADLAAAAEELEADVAASMEAVEEAAAALDKAGQEPSPTTVTPAAAAVAAAEASLPDPWELLYAAALTWGREAAVDELLGNQARSCRLYARAGTALSFLCSEAAGLELEPPAELAPADRTRLQKYAAATAVRWAACATAAAASPEGGEGPVR